MEEEKLPIFTPSDYASSELIVNPFFYKRKEDKFDSVEDFALKVKLGLFKKKEIVYVQSLIRNSQIDKKKRFKIFKKYLKVNKKDFDANLANQKEENEKDKKEFSSIEFKKVGLLKLFRALLFLALSVALSLMFLEKVTNLIPFAFVEKMHTNLMTFMENYKLYVILGIVVVNLFTAWFFIYLIVFGLANKKYARVQKRKQKAFERYIVSAKKAISKCYKRVIKYYKKNILSDNLNYEALTLDELWDLDVAISEEDSETEEQAKKSKRIIRSNKNFDRNCRFFTSIIIFLLVIILGFEIYNIFI